MIPINKTQGDEILSTTINTFAREAYLTCDNKMFSLILVPKDIPAQTIILKTASDEKRVEKNKEIEVVNDYQTTVSELIKSVYKEITPEGFDLEFSAFLFRQMGSSTSDSADCRESKKWRIKRSIH